MNAISSMTESLNNTISNLVSKLRPMRHSSSENDLFGPSMDSQPSSRHIRNPSSQVNLNFSGRPSSGLNHGSKLQIRNIGLVKNQI